MIGPFLDNHPAVDPSAYIAPGVVVVGDVEIGADASIWFGSVLRGDVNSIRIGARTNIQDSTVIHVSSHDHPTVIEDEVTVGHRVTLHGCYVETGSLIGIGSVLLDGVRIGRSSIVAAGSIVTPRTIVEPYTLVMGAPARVKRSLTEEEIGSLTMSWQTYVALAAKYRNHGTVNS